MSWQVRHENVSVQRLKVSLRDSPKLGASCVEDLGMKGGKPTCYATSKWKGYFEWQKHSLESNWA